MSPFCRQCLGIAREGEARCPLDQEFYLRRDCPNCAREVFPRELYCAHCGGGLVEAPETVLLPEEAGRLPVAIALALDLLGMVLVTALQLWMLPTLAGLLLGLVLTVVYRGLARAQGRQTFGQAVFHLLTVNRDASPAGYAASFRRTLAEPVFLGLSLLRGRAMLARLDDFSQTYEVRLA